MSSTKHYLHRDDHGRFASYGSSTPKATIHKLAQIPTEGHKDSPLVSSSVTIANFLHRVHNISLHDTMKHLKSAGAHEKGSPAYLKNLVSASRSETQTFGIPNEHPKLHSLPSDASHRDHATDKHLFFSGYSSEEILSKRREGLKAHYEKNYAQIPSGDKALQDYFINSFRRAKGKLHSENPGTIGMDVDHKVPKHFMSLKSEASADIWNHKRNLNVTTKTENRSKQASLIDKNGKLSYKKLHPDMIDHMTVEALELHRAYERKHSHEFIPGGIAIRHINKARRENRYRNKPNA